MDRSSHKYHLLCLFVKVDKVCVDQESIKERNHQVGIMREVYENARCTYSWLGHAGGESDWLFDTLNDEDNKKYSEIQIGRMTNVGKDGLL